MFFDCGGREGITGTELRTKQRFVLDFKIFFWRASTEREAQSNIAVVCNFNGSRQHSLSIFILSVRFAQQVFATISVGKKKSVNFLVWISSRIMGFLGVFFVIAFGFLNFVHGRNPEIGVLMEMKTILDPENVLLVSWESNGDPCNGSFEGVFCNELGNVVNISLQGKGLSGSVPSAISGLKSLTGLYLHYNSLTGEIPREISNLTELSDLYLNVNNLSGNIPPEIGTMINLHVLQLCCNQLTGSIPTQLGSLKKLSVLSLQSNQLSGAIPASLGYLSLLTRLDLSFNHLFGSVPTKIDRIPLLEVLDIRHNKLSGKIPSSLKKLNGGLRYENNSDLCGLGFADLRLCSSSSSNLLNPNRLAPFGEYSTRFPFKSKPESADIQTDCHKIRCSDPSKSPQIAVIVGVIAVIFAGCATVISAFAWYRRQKQKIGSTIDYSNSRISTDQNKNVRRNLASPLINIEYKRAWDPLADSQEFLRSFIFNLEEVESATQHFSEVNLLGKSNFASIFRGILKDGTVVAVKVINKTSCRSEETEFLKGLKTLTSLQHENLIGLKGFCCSRGRGECSLIYNYAVNGSLSEYLDGKDGRKNVLDWFTRVSVINGIARGIEYLHSNKSNKPSLLHQNISAEKVLLDQNFTPLISDSGLHKLLADDVVFSTLKATAAMGYLAPEYTKTGRFTEKSDVYAFGIIVFQILSGRREITNSIQLDISLEKLEDFMDANLAGKFSISEAGALAKIASDCTIECPERRPNMKTIVEELRKRTCSDNPSI